MIGHRFPAVGPVPAGTGGWASAVTISLVAHGVLIGSLLLTDSDISLPVAPQVFTVDVVMEATPSSKQPTAAKQVQSPAEQPPASSRPAAEDPPRKTVAERPDPVPVFVQKQTTATVQSKPARSPLTKAVYAPVPKAKPVLSPHPVTKEPVAETPASPSQEALLPDAGAALPSVPRDKAESGSGGAATASLVPPQLSARGGGNPLPPYPRAARRQGLEGRLVLRVTVTAQGTPGVVKVLESSGHALLDDAAVRAVMRWRFQPGRRGSLPVQASLDLPVVFRLKSDR